MSSSSLLEQMKKSRKSAHSAYTSFVTDFVSNDIDTRYCFFEGEEDKRYYGPRMSLKYNIKYKDFTCGGKDEVKKVIELISNIDEYKNSNVLYFVDKDYSDDSPSDKLYVTDCYSIENYYCLEDTLKKILQNEFNMEDNSEDFNKCLSLYKDLKKDFHNKLLILNLWLACQHDKKIQLGIQTHLDINGNLKQYFNPQNNMISTEFEIIDDSFENLDSKEFLEGELFVESPNIENEKLESKKSYFLEKEDFLFRGKFELKFMIDFLKRIKEEANSKRTEHIKNKYKCTLIFNLESATSSLTQYAETPECLIDFFNKNFEVA